MSCAIGVSRDVTSITLLSIGLSIPDLRACLGISQGMRNVLVALHCIIGSNSVNLCLGLGKHRNQKSNQSNEFWLTLCALQDFLGSFSQRIVSATTRSTTSALTSLVGVELYFIYFFCLLAFSFINIHCCTFTGFGVRVYLMSAAVWCIVVLISLRPSRWSYMWSSWRGITLSSVFLICWSAFVVSTAVKSSGYF
jgi:hypothetical protein